MRSGQEMRGIETQGSRTLFQSMSLISEEKLIKKAIHDLDRKISILRLVENVVTCWIIFTVKHNARRKQKSCDSFERLVITASLY